MRYRACYWISEDGQSEVVLTTPGAAKLSDEVLMSVARDEAARVGCDLTTGRLVIGAWNDGTGRREA